MRWFGFGFNAFAQICDVDKSDEGESCAAAVKVSSPTELSEHVDGNRRWKTSQITASWSRRAALHGDGDSCVCVAGFGSDVSSCCGTCVAHSYGCVNVFISETHLTLAFPHKIETWDLQKKEETPSWSMDLEAQSDCFAGLTLPLVPGGYIQSNPPFYRPLSAHMGAKRLALGAEHAVLLTASGAVYTWGLGSHGQLGHGGLTPEEKPKPVEALWGMIMGSVSAGGWHSVCVSDGGDLYVWGWNESGQLGLPSQSLRKASQKKEDCSKQTGASSPEDPQEEGKQEDVFISIQAFPALVDVTPLCEIRTVSCGSRHTAAATTAGDLYTWGWGEYGQLGHQTFSSSDEPQRVEFFAAEQIYVVDVVCGNWNTFVAINEEIDLRIENKHRLEHLEI
ncbi:RCC1 domain-containing protein 1 isoform X2 [Gouania willdenowi]|uniref:RCC1 domain-containing protein 1 isoform X2 n=1 Tax=Gouania willdenowi TaxID=441366 RepID=UPI001055ABFB|nr:RCC1 domain-containing protein 1 isoform X2 [Gouania willdenowi]